jgi:chromosome partitioning protein
LPGELVQALVDEGLPVLQPYLSSSVKVRESHQLARPMIHLDAGHKLTTEYIALFDALPGEGKPKAAKRKSRPVLD